MKFLRARQSDSRFLAKSFRSGCVFYFAENDPDTGKDEAGAEKRCGGKGFPAEKPAERDRAGRCDERNGLQICHGHAREEPVKKKKS